MVISNSQDVEVRFGHLLQPIRDLTKNWNVDIASQLEDYLEEIGTIAVTFDGGRTTLNFAEAALLIQGSASIYGKKVEYLHSLVYQVLELIASKKKLQAGSVDAEGRDKDVTFANRGQEEEFLLLDDIKDGKNITLRSVDSGSGDKIVHILPQMPLSLIPLEEGEKGDTPLINHKGEILGSQKDFRMNTSNIHPTGSLLLDLSHLDLLEMSFQNKVTSTPFIPRRAVMPDTVEPVTMEELPVDEGLPADVSMEEDDNFDINPPPDPELPDQPESPEQAERQDRMTLRRPNQNKHVAKLHKQSDKDPWADLEAHQDLTSEKNYKKKKTYKLQHSLETEDSKKRKRTAQAIALGEKRLQTIAQFCDQAFYSRLSKFPKNPLKVPTFPEFEELYWNEFKQRQNKVRKERQMLEEQGYLQELGEEIQEQEDNGAAEDFPALDDEDDDNDVEVPRVGFLIPDVQDLGPIQPEEIPDPFLEMEQDGLPQDCLKDNPIVSSYEELVRHHVEEYLASAQQYAQVTELSRRVSEWEDNILPKLQAEENHVPFDIHKYGSEVLGRLSDQFQPTSDKEETEEETIPFQKICQNKQSYEVCRLFLSTLQLANNYNVDISQNGTLSQAVDTMSLRKLSSRRHFEELEEYRAPSLDV